VVPGDKRQVDLEASPSNGNFINAHIDSGHPVAVSIDDAVIALVIVGGGSGAALPPTTQISPQGGAASKVGYRLVKASLQEIPSLFPLVAPASP
jgi:hypothetical protein